MQRRLNGGAVSRGSLPALLRALGTSSAAELTGAGGVVRGAAAHFRRLAARARCCCAPAPPLPLQALRLAEAVGGQCMTVLLGQTGAGSPSAVAALAAAIDARDDYTAAHSAQVVELAVRWRACWSLPPREIEHVRDGALLHDVGKVGIPNEILHKPGPLDEAEWAMMRSHPVIGERILRRTPELEEIAPLVRHEHERWDGAGYPDGLAGTDIPMGSRIILACDAYNAMITRRPYREPMSEHDAVAELRANAGSQFDPAVVDALLRVLSGWGVDVAQAMAGRPT